MKTKKDLQNILSRIDHRGYPAYKDTKGAYDFGGWILSIDHVQGDPFAAPSDVSILLPGDFPKEILQTRETRRAMEDHLTRKFGSQLKAFDGKSRGSGKSGKMSMSRPGQEILERTSCTIDEKTGQIRLRFHVGFPAQGRTVLARELEKILFDYVPKTVEKAARYVNYSDQEKEAVQKVWQLAMDQTAVRKQLKEKGLAAFVANGSILPRKSGISSVPMENAIPFVSPASLEVEMDLPYAGKITGMGIPKGVTLICGGGYHGKSTLLEALELGVYDHIKGDGRELVITDDTAVKSRAEDGRSVQNVNISAFIQDLPNGRHTDRFSSADASGSTSQAAGIVEAVQAGAKVLLLDEDTSAGNFMIRDELMQAVIHPDKEPIIPFIDRIRDLYEKEGVSTILVAGSSGSFFEKADTILQMDAYRPKEITALAKETAKQYPHKARTDIQAMNLASKRIPEPVKESGRAKVRSRGTDTVSIDRQEVDMRLVEQLCDSEQLSAIGQLLRLANRKYIDGRRTAEEVADLLEEDLNERGLDEVVSGSCARPRRQEILAALNRQRYMKID